MATAKEKAAAKAKAVEAAVVDTAPAVETTPADTSPKTPRFTPDGVLLNPEHFHVGSDGVLIPKA